MFPGYIYMYKDIDKYVHLFFFKGIDNNMKQIYKDIDLSNIPFNYSMNQINDYTYDYKFENKNIIKISCNLVDLNNNTKQKILTFK